MSATSNIAAPTREELARFLRAPLRHALRELEAARRSCVAPARRAQVQLYAPLYVSSYCANDCAYCGFRSSRAAQRVRLEPEQACDEARALSEHGHRSIDLVSGESPGERFVDQLCRTIEQILRLTPIERIHVNVGALSRVQYRRLFEAGARGCHVYQETYDAEVYSRVHRAGPKKDMRRRLEAPQRALDAGFESLGLGVLLGLGSDRAGEVVALCEHASTLARRRPALRLGFSLPRLRPAADEAAWPETAPAVDGEFVKLLAFLASRFPSADISVTTRERPRLRDFLLARCATKVSAGVQVSAGGYRAGMADSASQFRVADRRSLREMERVIRACGKQPVYA